MRIALDYRKNVEKNAQEYFEKAKQARQKIEGAKDAIQKKREELQRVEQEEIEINEPDDTKQRDKAWYEKYHWFYTTNDLLVIGGRDAATNEYVIKKHSQKGDLVFHTDMSGSPFVLMKNGVEEATNAVLEQAATFTLAYSSAWKEGLTTASVFYVTPDQVSKEAQAGEYLAKGSFMIYGDTTYVDASINFAIGRYDKAIMGGPVEAIKHHCDDHVEVEQGREKTSDVAKQIQHEIGGDLDEIIQTLPAGGATVRKV